MANERSQDWIPPLLLILAALLIGIIGWGVWALVDDDAEEETIAGQLEAYTSCLDDNGANVPLIQTRSDGGFAVIVPGSLLEGDIDFERWHAARDACRHLEPNPLELLFSSGDLEMGDLELLAPFFERGFGLDRRRGPGLFEACERLERGNLDDRDVPPELEELCHELGG